MVARSLEKGDFGFSTPSSSEAEPSFFLPKLKGRVLLRFSALGVSLVSPLVAGAASVAAVSAAGCSAGAAAGAATSVERGSVVSTAGITGAVSETASAGVSLGASAAGAAFFLPKWKWPRMLYQVLAR